MAYNPQPAYGEPAIATRKHEDARGLEFPGFADTPSAFSSMEGRAQPVNPFQRGRLWLAHRFCYHHMISDPQVVLPGRRQPARSGLLLLTTRPARWTYPHLLAGFMTARSL
jgi:hypothetical protein